MMHIFKQLFNSTGNNALKAAINDGALLVDVRSAGEFDTGHIEGSLNIPLDQLSFQLHRLQKDKTIVVYCRSGNRSKAAKAILLQKGFINVVDGGSINNVYQLLTA
ncbi:MAG TPA: rhodanese-like domain-containing protein [Ferruginibacter sp.]|nr:rhodanese-like domain-containing protein [Ferruginibacter sp.]HMP20749.1 rhodanese-like domain-containing protein [Ferruginibacter sp.]